MNRLDLPVSGIVICTKSGGDVAKKYCMEIMTQKVAKKYLCRVDGNFPEYVQYYPFFLLAFQSKPSISLRSLRKCEAPLFVDRATGKTFTGKGNKEPKQATTEFERLGYDPESNTSLVLCKPLTGNYRYHPFFKNADL